MTTVKYQTISYLLGLLMINPAFASISDDLKMFFDKAGMHSNVNSAGVYQDQAAGYYTGGSITARSEVRNAQLATMQLPGYRAGCGGIDLWQGGISHIKAEELVKMLRSVGSAMASYGFLLSVQTVSPQIYNLLNELNALATKINTLNINSCETAATMLGGLWPKSDQSSKHLCQARGTNLGEFSDWAAARQGCGAGGKRSNILNIKDSDPRYKDILAGEFNLTWKALQLNSFLSGDRELAELFLTLVGSIISRKAVDKEQLAVQRLPSHEDQAAELNARKAVDEGQLAIQRLPSHEDQDAELNARKAVDEGQLAIQILPSHADQDAVLNGLLNGGKTPIYRCDNDQCLYPELKNINVPEQHTLRRKVQTTLEALIDKVYEDAPITPSEQTFLNATRLPVYKMLNVTTAYRKGAAPVDLHHYGDLIALDLLYKYVVDVLDLVQDSVARLKAVQVNDQDVDHLLKHLKIARERITVRRSSAFQQMDNVLSFIQATQLIEKQLHVMLGGVANEHNWF